MARYIGSVCRLCRREGEKLFLKGERCFTSKCAIERRDGAPGQHGHARQSRSDYRMQLREKQKVKRIYGMLEKQFRSYFKKAASQKGVTGTLLLQRLESRLDSVAFKLGFGSSRSQARQRVLHGHVLVNGKKVDIPSYLVSVGDVVELVPELKKNIEVVASVESAAARLVSDWLTLDKDAMRGTVNAIPTREALSQSIQEHLIVELYSK
ncbi:MAG: 30S ribosomal protein S4 [Bdellovibrionota bacterium]|jgi:small subunit ribosomal protein S4